MANLGLVVASDIANALLTDYVKSDSLSQTTQDKPLLRVLYDKKEEFPGGKDNVSSPVKGVFMSDTVGFLQGYSEDDQLNFNQGDNTLRAAYPWKSIHSGLEITFDEMAKDGISIDDQGKTSEHKNASVVRIVTSLFKERIDDFGESWSRATNLMFWGDGSQDAKQIPGIRSLLTETPAVGSTGGLDRASNIWWRHRFLAGATAITASAENQTLTKTLRSELRQLCRYGGRPRVALCGSKFIDGLELEVHDKGLYSQEGFTNTGKTDAGMAQINMSYGVDRRAKDRLFFEYDPSLDDMGFAKRCYMIDTNRIRFRPMTGELNKLWVPARPYNYMVFFKSMTTKGAMEATQLNSSGIYEVN